MEWYAYLMILEAMMRDYLPRKICESSSMQNVFELLRSYPCHQRLRAYNSLLTELSLTELPEQKCYQAFSFFTASTRHFGIQ